MDLVSLFHLFSIISSPPVWRSLELVARLPHTSDQCAPSLVCDLCVRLIRFLRHQLTVCRCKCVCVCVLHTVPNWSPTTTSAAASSHRQRQSIKPSVCTGDALVLVLDPVRGQEEVSSLSPFFSSSWRFFTFDSIAKYDNEIRRTGTSLGESRGRGQEPRDEANLSASSENGHKAVRAVYLKSERLRADYCSYLKLKVNCHKERVGGLSATAAAAAAAGHHRLSPLWRYGPVKFNEAHILGPDQARLAVDELVRAGHSKWCPSSRRKR